jgi:ABC-type multidrug transport system fused ATPase/permease subunit
LGILIVVVAVPLLILSTAFFRILDINYYREAAVQSNIYQEATNVIINYIEVALGDLFAEATSDLEGISPVLLEKFSDTVKQEFTTAVGEVVSPTLLSTIVDRNLNNLLSYLNGQGDDLLIYIPKESLRAALGKVAGDVTDALQNTLLTIPTCTGEQSANFEGGFDDLECVPPGFAEQLDTTKINSVAENFDEILEQATLFGGEEELALRDFMAEVATLGDEAGDGIDLDSAYRVLNRVRDAIFYAKAGLLISWIVLVVLITTYTFMATGNFAHRIKGTGFLLLTIGVLSAFLVLISLFIGVPIGVSYLKEAVVSQGAGVELQTIFVSFLESILRGLLYPMLYVSLILMAIGVVEWIGFGILGKIGDVLSSLFNRDKKKASEGTAMSEKKAEGKPKPVSQKLAKPEVDA